MDRGKKVERAGKESVCSGVGCGKMDRPTRRAINHCQREGEKWGKRDGRAAERKEKKKRASDGRETGSDGVRDERLGKELKRWTVGETNSGEKSCGIGNFMETEAERRSVPTCGKNGLLQPAYLSQGHILICKV